MHLCGSLSHPIRLARRSRSSLPHAKDHYFKLKSSIMSSATICTTTLSNLTGVDLELLLADPVKAIEGIDVPAEWRVPLVAVVSHSLSVNQSIVQ